MEVIPFIVSSLRKRKYKLSLSDQPMIQDLYKILEQLLKQASLHGLVSQAAISFTISGNQFPPTLVTLQTIDRFLYDTHGKKGSSAITNGSCNGKATAWLRKSAPDVSGVP